MCQPRIPENAFIFNKPFVNALVLKNQIVFQFNTLIAGSALLPVKITYSACRQIHPSSTYRLYLFHLKYNPFLTG